MTPESLRSLVAEATGTLEHISGDSIFIASEQDAALIALAPELALLVADMAEAMEKTISEYDGLTLPDLHSSLSRLAALEER